MLFCTAFVFQFLIAGLTGIMLVGRRHGTGSCTIPTLSSRIFTTCWWAPFVFYIFAAIYYWYPKVTGRMLSEKLGKWHFWLFLIGFHVTFDTMHFVGILGMPRSIYTYEPDRGWNTLNMIISAGGFIQAIAVLIFAWNLVDSYFHGKEGRQRSLGCVDAGMVNAVAAARL